MDYYSKYLKYKQKYLKQKNLLIGGEINEVKIEFPNKQVTWEWLETGERVQEFKDRIIDEYKTNLKDETFKDVLSGIKDFDLSFTYHNKYFGIIKDLTKTFDQLGLGNVLEGATVVIIPK